MNLPQLNLSKQRWQRLVVRAVYVLVVLFILRSLYFVYDRARYERLINRLYITFDDFDPAYSEALSQLPETDKPLRNYDQANYPAAEPDTNIPSLIHFIWYENLYETKPDVTDIPSMGSHAPDNCRATNPDFEVKVWGAEEGRQLLVDHYPWFLGTYDNYRYPIQRVDAVKYFILYHYGGIYLDLDISCRRSLRPIQRFPAWVPRASPQGLNNDAFAARAKHPAWKHMIESLTRRNKSWIFPYLTIFWSTGPQFTTDMIKEYLEQNPEEAAYVPGDPKIPTPDEDAVYILPQEFYSEQYTFFGHSPGGTWHEADVAVVLWFVARPWMVVVVLACAIVVPSVTCITIYLNRRRKRALRHKEEIADAEELENLTNGDLNGDLHGHR